MIRLGGGFPVLSTDDGQADLPLLVHIGVVDFSFEGDLGGLEGVLGWEADLDSESTFVVRRIVLVIGQEREGRKLQSQQTLIPGKNWGLAPSALDSTDPSGASSLC